jgi:hypothetical protein
MPLADAALRSLFNMRNPAVIRATTEQAERIVKTNSALYSQMEEERRVAVIQTMTAAILAVGVGSEAARLCDVDAFLFTQDKTFRAVAGDLRQTQVEFEPVRRYVQGVGNFLLNLPDRALCPIFLGLNAVLYDLRVNAVAVSSSFQNAGVR